MGRFYNGVTLEDIHSSGFEKGCTTKDGESTVNGIQAMAEQGIVGRGVLLDFHSWRLAQDPPIPHEPFRTGSIPLKYLKATAEAQGTEIKFGDILIIRSGISFLSCPPFRTRVLLMTKQVTWLPKVRNRTPSSRR